MPADADLIIGELRARMAAVERRQEQTEDRQEEILSAVRAIQSQLDQAAGGARVIRWATGFFGLSTVAGLVSFLAWIGDWTRIGGR